MIGFQWKQPEENNTHTKAINRTRLLSAWTEILQTDGQAMNTPTSAIIV